MSNSLEQVWSDAPNAPQIPSWQYLAEKEHLAGMLFGAVFYGALTNTHLRIHAHLGLLDSLF